MAIRLTVSIEGREWYCYENKRPQPCPIYSYIVYSAEKMNESVAKCPFKTLCVRNDRGNYNNVCKSIDLEEITKIEAI